MALQITHTDTVRDHGIVDLDFVHDVTTAVIAGTTYLFAQAFPDDAITVFSVGADGTLTHVATVSDNATLELDAAWALTTAVVAGTTYLFVAGTADDGVSVFSVPANGIPFNVHNVTDDATLQLDGAREVATAVVAGTAYLFVAEFFGLSVFSVAPDGTLTNTANVSDDATLELAGIDAMTTAVVSGTTYLFVAGSADDGVSVFSVAANGTLTNVANVSDDATLQLDGSQGVTTAVIAGSTYLFVAGEADNGVSVFRVASDGTLVNVANAFDDATLHLGGPKDVTTALIDGITYLFVTSAQDGGFSVFSVAADGTLTNVANVSDNDDLALATAYDMTTAVVNGITHLFAAGRSESGVSVFAVADVVEGSPGDTQLGDVLWRHSDGSVATATHDLGAVPNNWRIATTGDFDADRDSDIMWRHRDGLVVTWEMEGGQYLTNHNIAFASTGWEIVDAGDFDADGDADVLWRHRDGAVVTWEMENGEYVVNHNIAFASTGWEIDGLGDFDADGDADIIWRHRDGAVVTWEMENGQYVVNHNIAFGATSWRIEGTGDFDADGDADILWRHDQGDVVTWEMEGGAYVTNHNLPALATSWQIAGAEDFDSDGDADILWRHDQGDVMTWEMENGAYVANHDFGVVANAWAIVRTGEFDLV